MVNYELLKLTNLTKFHMNFYNFTVAQFPPVLTTAPPCCPVLLREYLLIYYALL